MNMGEFDRSCNRAALENRSRLCLEAIKRGDSLDAEEQARWAAHLAMSVKMMDANIPGWGIYLRVKEYWESA